MKLSVLIPAHNEEDSIRSTIIEIYSALLKNNITHEILVVNDHSRDKTAEIVNELLSEVPTLRCISNPGMNGFGYAIRAGLENFSGDCIALMMGDMSDSPAELVQFYNKLLEGYDCVFGSRFIKGGKTYNYPTLKLIINRVANSIIRICFGIRYNDTTNAFKIYKKETIEGLKPFLSPHFNITLELPLKAIVRGYSYTVLPNSWTNRKSGKSNLKIREMGSRYFFILLYCMIERFFSKGDFKKTNPH